MAGYREDQRRRKQVSVFDGSTQYPHNTNDAQGNAYVTRQTAANHAFVVKISADGSSFIYTVVLVGSNQDSAKAVVADVASNAS